MEERGKEGVIRRKRSRKEPGYVKFFFDNHEEETKGDKWMMTRGRITA